MTGKKRGRPRGASTKARTFAKLIAEGQKPLDAARLAGYGDPLRAVQRLRKADPELRAAAADAHAEIVSANATVMSGSTVTAVERLTSIIAWGEDRDAVSAARALNTITPEPDEKRRARCVTVLYVPNGRGPDPQSDFTVTINDQSDLDRTVKLLTKALSQSPAHLTHLAIIWKPEPPTPRPAVEEVVSLPIVAPPKKRRSVLDSLTTEVTQ